MKTILVVEDEAHIQRLIQMNLRRAGYCVLQATTGSEALIAVQTQHTDIIILDMILPDIDGYELLRVLKTSDYSRSLPVIALAPKAQDTEVFRGWGGTGVDAWLTKPFNPMELISFVKRILGETSEEGSTTSWVCLF